MEREEKRERDEEAYLLVGRREKTNGKKEMKEKEREREREKKKKEERER